PLDETRSRLATNLHLDAATCETLIEGDQNLSRTAARRAGDNQRVALESRTAGPAGNRPTADAFFGRSGHVAPFEGTAFSGHINLQALRDREWLELSVTFAPLQPVLGPGDGHRLARSQGQTAVLQSLSGHVDHSQHECGTC